MSKLYIIVSEDLHAGAQSAQAVHCAFEFQKDHPEIHKNWYDESNTIVILQAPQARLEDLLYFGQGVSHFREPDFDDMLTAVALAPTKHSEALCSDLKLQGSNYDTRRSNRKRSRIRKAFQGIYAVLATESRGGRLGWK